MEEERKSELEMAPGPIKKSYVSRVPVMRKANRSTQSSKLSQVSPTSALDPEWKTVDNNFGKRLKIKHKLAQVAEKGSPPSLPISNSFQALSDIEMDESDAEDPTATPVKVPRKHKPPPIIIHKHLNSPTKTLKRAQEITKAGLDVKCTAQNTIFITKTVEDHSAMKEFLNKEDLPYHTYPLAGQGLVKMILRGLSQGTDPDDIAQDLLANGLSIKKIVQMKKDGQPIHLFLCLFAPGTEIKQILGVKKLCFTIINWTKYKNKAKYIQCYRCLGFNHRSNTCSCPEKCIKCGGPHQNRLCNASSPRCANCGREHWANDEECPAVIRATQQRKDAAGIKQLHQGKPEFHKPPTNSETNYPHLPSVTASQQSTATLSPWISSQTKEVNTSHQNQTSSIGMIQELLTLMASPEIKKIIGKCIALLRSLSKARTGADRVKILLEEGLAILE